MFCGGCSPVNRVPSYKNRNPPRGARRVFRKPDRQRQPSSIRRSLRQKGLFFFCRFCFCTKAATAALLDGDVIEIIEALLVALAKAQKIGIVALRDHVE